MRNLINGLLLGLVTILTLDAYGVEPPNVEPPNSEQSNSGSPAAESAINTQTDEALEAQLLQLNARLQLLEEDLLYPASSRVAIYLAMDLGELFALDAVTVKLNGEDVTHHLYTERQVKALYKGGVQKLYVGNAKQGMNRLTAFFMGEGPHNRDYKRATTIEFEHSFEPVFVELLVTDDTGSQQPEFVARVF